MKKEDAIELEKEIRKLLSELAQKIERIEGDNLISVSLTGSTVQKEMKYNQDVDIFIVLKKIEGEEIDDIIRDLTLISKGKLDLEYKPNIPKIEKIFDDIVSKYTNEDTTVKYKFALGNYWGKPAKGKKYTIHLHVLGPHSVDSLRVRIEKFHKVILANAINNSEVILGEDLRNIFRIKITPEDILSTLSMLKLRQENALKIIDSDPDLALQISIKNLGKIAMASLEIFDIFESSTLKAGKLFKKRFNFSYNDLPEKAYKFKVEKEMILEDKQKVSHIVKSTDYLFQSVINFMKKSATKP